MSRYRNIHVTIWNDADFRAASKDAKLVFLHILTTPLSTPFGAFKTPVFALADEIGFLDADEADGLKGYRKAFRECLGEGFIEYDESTRFLLIPKYLKYNPPRNPNVLKSWVAPFGELPDCDLKLKLYKTLEATVYAMSKGFQEVFAESFGESFRKGFSVSKSTPSLEFGNTGSGSGTGTGSESESGAGRQEQDQDAGEAVIPATWEPDEMDLEAVDALPGATPEFIEQVIPRFRIYLREREIEGNPCPPARVSKSFYKFCDRELSDHQHGSSVRFGGDLPDTPDEETEAEKKERRENWLAENGFSSSEEARDYQECFSEFKHRQKFSLPVDLSAPMFTALSPGLQERLKQELEL